MNSTTSNHKRINSFKLTSAISEAEAQFLRLEVLNGEFISLSEAQRHYFRKGLESEGLLEAALAI